MKKIHLRTAEVDRDFAQLAVLFTLEQGELTTEAGLKEDHQAHKERIFRLMVAEDQQGELLGFNWATHSRHDPGSAYFYLIVKPDQRRQGVGARLYEDVEQAARVDRVDRLEIDVWDHRLDCLAFAQRRGFSQRSHRMMMELDLCAFNDQPYDQILDQLKAEGFEFTCMAALGNTEQAQRKLYALNDMTSIDIPGSEGEHPWDSFEDFQQRVCQANWYKPDGQMVVIDSHNGIWAGMSAITRFEGTDHAYNLHTGVDKRFRRRKLGQAVKVTALRYAREVLKVERVRTHHNALNLPMIAIDRKFGYYQLPGTYTMEKYLVK